MPILKSAIKKLKADRRRHLENLKISQAYKRALKQARLKPTLKSVGLAFSRLDRAAKKKVIAKNKASRLKSRLARHLPGKH